MDSASNATLTPTGDALSAKDPHDVWVAVLGNALVFCIFLGLSADVNIVDFKSKFSFQSNQWRALFAGICCQFFIMPLIGFSIVNIFSLSEARGIILLVVASSPGGAFSNWWCNLFNADLALSIAMTTCSTLLSLGLLPLNTFVFVTLSFGTNVPVNYVALGVTCGLVLVGTATGLAAGHLFPGCKYALHVLGNVAALASIICSLVLSSGGAKPDPIWSRDWSFYVSCGVMASVGLVLGVVIATLMRLSKPERVALAIETMYQNTSIASSAALSMFTSAEQTADALGIPLFYGAVCAEIIFVFCLVAWKCDWTLAPASEPFFRVLLRSYQPVHEAQADAGPAEDAEGCCGGLAGPPAGPHARPPPSDPEFQDPMQAKEDEEMEDLEPGAAPGGQQASRPVSPVTHARMRVDAELIIMPACSGELAGAILGVSPRPWSAPNDTERHDLLGGRTASNEEVPGGGSAYSVVQLSHHGDDDVPRSNLGRVSGNSGTW